MIGGPGARSPSGYRRVNSRGCSTGQRFSGESAASEAMVEPGGASTTRTRSGGARSNSSARRRRTKPSTSFSIRPAARPQTETAACAGGLRRRSLSGGVEKHPW